MHFGEASNQQVLRAVRILVLVDHDETELLRVLRAYPFRLLEQIHGLQEQVVEIERAAVLQRLQIERVHLRDLLVLAVPACVCGDRIRTFHPILRVADARQRHARLNEGVVDVEIFQRALDDRQLIGRVVDDEIAREADRGRFTPQKPRAQRVKRRHPHAAALRSEERLDARAHLFRGLVRKRDREHFVRLGVSIADEVRDAAGDDTRLA